jgi:hypothetical protein
VLQGTYLCVMEWYLEFDLTLVHFPPSWTRVRFLVAATDSWMRKYPLRTERTLLVCLFPQRQLHFKGVCANGTERCHE